MKVIFLDIDGVLNSNEYDRERGENDGNVDVTRLEKLRSIVDSTGAIIVLSSSWRRHWDREESAMDEAGKELSRLFKSYGLDIYDKTPDFGYVYGRSKEIACWLNENPDVQSFVILDDMPFAWGDYASRHVKTGPRVGRGLEDEHVSRAIDILNNGAAE